MPEAAIALLIGVFALSAYITWRLSLPGAWFQVLDYPNERSLHERPTPRLGGLAMTMALGVGALLLSWWLQYSTQALWIAAAALLISLVSLFEDRFGVKRRYRLLAHFIAAGLLLAADLHIGGAGGWLGVLASLFLIVWMINLYNFMDGMDGFAAGMAVIGFSALAWAGFQAGHAEFALAAALVAAAAAGFLLWNFPPARIFMGDSGSAMLGLLAVAFCLWGDRLEVLPLWAGLLVFSPFVVDASITLGLRLLRGERIWEAHRSHYYQRLVQLGWGHRKTVLRAYVLMLACAFSGVQAAAMSPTDVRWLLAMWLVIYLLIAFKVRHLEGLQ